MVKSFVKLISLVMIFTLATGSAVMAADAAKKHHIVLHVTDSNPVKWNQALNNAKNLQKALGKENVDVEIVVNGPGLDMMMFDSVVGNRLSAAAKDGISLLACGATMKAKKVTKKDLHDGVHVVPGGVVEIMQKQEAGWTYIKI